MSRTRVIIYIALIILLTGVLALEVRSVYSTQRSAAEINSQAETLSGNDSWTRSLRSAKADTSGDVATLDEVSITQTELIALIENLEKVGRQSGLKVTFSSLNTESGEASSTPQIVKMVVDTEGAWGPTMTFVRLLQSLPVRSEVTNASVNLSEKAWRSGTTLKVTILPNEE